jgi:hypothetical protein
MISCQTKPYKNNIKNILQKYFTTMIFFFANDQIYIFEHVLKVFKKSKNIKKYCMDFSLYFKK